MTDAVDRLATLPDRFDQLREATEGLAAAQRDVTEIARFRRQLISDLRAEGWTYAQIAEKAGLTRGRIHQIRTAGPAAEGAFFGRGALTIITPLKRDEIGARPVVAVEDVTITNQISELARNLHLEPSAEHIGIDGQVDLNRPNLLVICGPRLSPPVAKMYAADPYIAWEKSAAGPWTLYDKRTGIVYRSGQDENPPRQREVAYFGRLPRLDSDGTLLAFTGIHPQGSLGVAHLLTNELSELYQQVKTDCFSTIVGSDYDPDTGAVRSVELLTPLYRHQDA